MSLNGGRFLFVFCLSGQFWEATDELKTFVVLQSVSTFEMFVSVRPEFGRVEMFGGVLTYFSLLFFQSLS